MSAPAVVFVDCETTGLHADARPWEIAMIRREPPRYNDLVGRFVREVPDAETWLMVSDVDLADADLHALRLGGFHDRHPKYALPEDAGRHVKGLSTRQEGLAARRVEEVTRGAVLVGSNPAYDARVLSAMLRRHGLCPAWHYRVVDLPTYAAGQLDATDPSRPAWPDWRSEQTTTASGALLPSPTQRHTALGDARWCRDWWDHLERSRTDRLQAALAPGPP